MDELGPVSVEDMLSEPILRMFGARRMPADNNGEFAHVEFPDSHSATTWAIDGVLMDKSRFRELPSNLDSPVVITIDLR